MLQRSTHSLFRDLFLMDYLIFCTKMRRLSMRLSEEMPDSAHLFFCMAGEDVSDWELHLKSTDDFEVHHVVILALQVRNYGHFELPDTSRFSQHFSLSGAIFIIQICWFCKIVIDK
ncbi:hypothetical protein LXL04_013868 [Taraxacum kok-saghyz]